MTCTAPDGVTVATLLPALPHPDRLPREDDDGTERRRDAVRAGRGDYATFYRQGDLA